VETGIAPSVLLNEPEDHLNAMLFFLRWRNDPSLRGRKPTSNRDALRELDGLL